MPITIDAPDNECVALCLEIITEMSDLKASKTQIEREE
jgi:hypothetical protein